MKEIATIQIWISNCPSSNHASISSFEANALILTFLICEMGITAVYQISLGETKFLREINRKEKRFIELMVSVHSHLT